MKRTIFAIITFICFLPVFGQEAEEGIVTYVDSVPQNMTYRTTKIALSGQRRKDAEVSTLYSREKKIIVEYDNDDYLMTTGIIRCLKMAIDTWESKIDITTPFKISFEITEELDSDIEIQTEVRYSRNNRETMPASLYYQGHSQTNSVGTIKLNANIEWNYSWADDEGMSGSDNLTTALLRHIAHILGFGSSDTKRADGYGFSIGRTPSKFDSMVSNGQRTLASLARGGNSADFDVFFKSELFLQLPNKTYPLYSSPNGYVQYRTGKYFCLSNDNIMNYPYCDKTVLFGVNKETLEVLEAIGWSVKPYDVTITGTDIDATGYGSIYLPHIFHAYDDRNNILDNITWRYQLYNGTEFIDKQTCYGSSFSLNPSIESDDYNDEFVCRQARIVCSTTRNGKVTQYYYPLYLELKPLFSDYEISNVKENADNRFYSYDIRLRFLGVNNGFVSVYNDGGETISHRIGNEEETQIHVSKAYKIETSYLDIELYNQYGTTARFLYINEGLFARGIGNTNEINISSTDPDSNSFDIYTIQGIKVKNKVELKDLPKGNYIIKNIKHPWESRKYMVK